MLTQEQLELINQLFKRAEQSSLQSGTIRIKDFSFSFEQKSPAAIIKPIIPE